jgi:Trk-type K+ transport system membrane component
MSKSSSTTRFNSKSLRGFETVSSFFFILSSTGFSMIYEVLINVPFKRVNKNTLQATQKSQKSPEEQTGAAGRI